MSASVCRILRSEIRVRNGDCCSSTDSPWRSVSSNTGSPVLLDRKSTRLNSSHLVISYAVFCLKKTKGALQATACGNKLVAPTPIPLASIPAAQRETGEADQTTQRRRRRHGVDCAFF